MSILDDVVVNAKTAANVVSKKAGVIYDISKLKLSAANLRGELNRKYRDYGEAVYSNSAVEDQETLKTEITELKAELKDIYELLKVARNQSTCPECGANVIKGAQFCYSCGATLIQDGLFCKKCGAKLYTDSKFCINCGTPVVNEEETSNSTQTQEG